MIQTYFNIRPTLECFMLDLDKEDIKAILETYDVGSLISSSYIPEGHMNTCYKVETDKDTYLLRLYHRSHYHSKTVSEIRLEHKILRRLQGIIPVPKVYQDKNKEKIFEYNNHFGSIYEFIRGKNISDPSKQQIQSVAKITTTLHEELQSFTPEEAKQNQRFNKEKLKNHFQTLQGMDDFPSKYKKTVREAIQDITLPDLPKTITHTDLHFGNLLFKDNTITALLDFDSANRGKRIMEIASFIRYEAYEDHLQPDIAKTFLEEYQKYIPLTKKEKHNLYEATRLFNMINLTAILHWKDTWNQEHRGIRFEKDLKDQGKDKFTNSIFSE